MKRRFWTRPNDREIVDKSHALKLEIYKDDETGELSGTFELRGAFGRLLDEDCATSPSEGLAFIRDLIAEFEKKRPPGTCPAE